VEYELKHADVCCGLQSWYAGVKHPLVAVIKLPPKVWVDNQQPALRG
jgi:hypothetical protein